MNDYLTWDKKTIKDFSEENITDLYNQGYVFVRTKKGAMQQTRSLRIDLSKIKLSSENRRVLKKFPKLDIFIDDLPMTADEYDWHIHKMGKDFYSKKFGDKTFSASKIRELITKPEKSNFNRISRYLLDEKPIGYTILYENKDIVHYAYPFYDFENYPTNLGMVMMLQAIIYAKDFDKKYIYLGSIRSAKDKYKLQFSGLEWFNEVNWDTELQDLKMKLN